MSAHVKRSILLIVPPLLLASFFLVARGGGIETGASASAAEKGPTINDFMLAVHDGKGLLVQIGQALGAAGSAGPADEKAWKSVHARAAVLTSLIELTLLRSMPAKGDKASWKAKVGSYHAAARALATATGKRNAGAAREAKTKLSRSCTPCHDAHQ